ncbi:MAG TPA: MgtC/SapB family protein [Thermohalobaculum sp.]|nr:MgtC/SapB family protein [Thermohalobaculum sp.]
MPDWLGTHLPDREAAFRLLVATVVGALIGLERELSVHSAGLRTHALVSLAAALFTVITFQIFESVQAEGGQTADPIRVVEAVTSGVAFIAAGAIIHGGRGGVKGLTTGAGLWLAGALGVAAGLGQYGIMTTALVLALILLGIVRLLTKPEPDE